MMPNRRTAHRHFTLCRETPIRVTLKLPLGSFGAQHLHASNQVPRMNRIPNDLRLEYLHRGVMYSVVAIYKFAVHGPCHQWAT